MRFKSEAVMKQRCSFTVILKNQFRTANNLEKRCCNVIAVKTPVSKKTTALFRKKRSLILDKY